MAALELAGWRRAVTCLYAAVRSAADPREAHSHWRRERDRLFREHPQSPLDASDPLRASGLPYWPYDPALRFTVAVRPAPRPDERRVETSNDGPITMRLAGRVTLPHPVGADLDVWWLRQYAGGLFLPVRDGTAGRGSYGAGRYLLDSAKGADLGGDAAALVVDLNFLYHPSCRYNPRWECPLAPDGNTVPARIEAGERM